MKRTPNGEMSIVLLVLTLWPGVSEVESRERRSTPSSNNNQGVFVSAPPVLYLKDGEGMFIHYFPQKKECLYRCGSENCTFFQEEVVLSDDLIVFGMADTNEEYHPSVVSRK